MIEAQISGQKLNITQPFVVADTIDYLEMKFTFLTKDWDNAIKWAHFENKDKKYLIKLVDDNITKKMHLNLSKGDWTVWVHGNIGDERITTNRMNLKVLPTGDMSGEPLPITPPSAGEQIQKTANEAKEIAQSVRDDADAGKFNGEKGDKGDKGDSGVYVGADPVPEGTKVQVDPTAKSKAIIIPEKTSELENDSDFATNKSVDDKIANIPSGDSGISRLVILPKSTEFRHDSFNISANNTLVLLFSISPYDNVTHNSKFTGFPKIKSIGDGFYAFDKNLITKVMLYSLGNGHTADFSELITDFDDSAVVCNEIYVAGDSPELLGLVKIKCETAELANSLKETIANVIDSGSFLVAFIFQEIQDTIISEEIV